LNKVLLSLIFAAFLAGCAGTVIKTDAVPATATVPAVPATTTIDLTKGTLEVATHNDLLGAAAVATKAAAAATKLKDAVLAAALQARATFWTALDTLLTAQEQQGSACGNAILAMKPTPPTLATGSGPHLFTDIEILAEDVGQFTGITPAAKLACTQITIPTLPALPKL
jgi:uncharacterized protein YceK